MIGVEYVNNKLINKDYLENGDRRFWLGMIGLKFIGKIFNELFGKFNKFCNRIVFRLVLNLFKSVELNFMFTFFREKVLLV